MRACVRACVRVCLVVVVAVVVTVEPVQLAPHRTWLLLQPRPDNTLMGSLFSWVHHWTADHDQTLL